MREKGIFVDNFPQQASLNIVIGTPQASRANGCKFRNFPGEIPSPMLDAIAWGGAAYYIMQSHYLQIAVFHKLMLSPETNPSVPLL